MNAQFVVVRAEEAERLAVGERTTLVGPQALSGGSYNVMDQELGPGLLVPAHAHTLEDQAVFVLTGTLTVWVDGIEREVTQGGYALRPAGKPHAIWNAAGETVRFVEITSPAERFEEYIRRISALNEAGESSPDSIAALAAEYGVTFLPDVTAELEARTGTSARGASGSDVLRWVQTARRGPRAARGHRRRRPAPGTARAAPIRAPAP